MPEKIAAHALSWASALEEKTRAQAVLTSQMPFIHPHLTLDARRPPGRGGHRRLEQLRGAMVGIEWRDSEAFLDEIPGAYEDIDVVMAELIEVVHELRQIVNVKGT